MKPRMAVCRLLALAICLALGSCTTQAVVTPRGPGSGRLAPQITLGYVAAYGQSTGSLSVRMPNGDRLEGAYTFVAAPSAGPFCFGVCSAATASFGSDEILTHPLTRPAVGMANNGRGKSISCDLAIADVVHGTGRCRLNTGELYQISF